MIKWHRIEDGYESGEARIYDNGGGVGPAAGSGRWAVEILGQWIANVDTLAAAKERAAAELEALAQFTTKPLAELETRGETARRVWDEALAADPNLTTPRLVRIVAEQTGFTTSEVLALRFPSCRREVI